MLIKKYPKEWRTRVQFPAPLRHPPLPSVGIIRFVHGAHTHTGKTWIHVIEKKQRKISKPGSLDGAFTVGRGFGGRELRVRKGVLGEGGLCAAEGTANVRSKGLAARATAARPSSCVFSRLRSLTCPQNRLQTCPAATTSPHTA